MASVFEQIQKEIKSQQEAQNNEFEDLDIEAINIGQFDAELTNLIQQHQTLISLSLVECQLKTLEGFPKLNQLENLILEGNQLDGSAVLFISKNFKKLVCLSLADNRINTLEDLAELKQLKSLQQLDLSDNPVAKVEGYFNKVFEIIPNLKVLDSKDKKGQDISFSEDEEDGDDDVDLDDDDEDEFDDDEDDDEPEVKQTKKTKK